MPVHTVAMSARWYVDATLHTQVWSCILACSGHNTSHSCRRADADRADLLSLKTGVTQQDDSPNDVDAAEVATAVALVRQLDGSVGHEQARTTPPVLHILHMGRCMRASWAHVS